MKSKISQFMAAMLIYSLIIVSSGCGTSSPTNNANSATNTATNANANSAEKVAQPARYTDDELDELFARIALYPDPILAQLIPAATFVDKLAEAARTLGGKADDSLIANQDWPVSVKSVAHYPQVLKMMVDNQDWTTAVGQAYVNQPQDVAKSIQRLRQDAKAAGNLKSTPQQKVLEENGALRIVPAEPKVIYVPEYNPETVYVAPAEEDKGVSTGTVVAIAAVTFGLGLLIGSWLNNDYDYYGRGIYYHGWNGPGWVTVNRRYIDVDRNVYINNNFNNIDIDRNVVNRPVPYRDNLRRDADKRRDRMADTRAKRDRDKDLNVGDKIDRSKPSDDKRPDLGGDKRQDLGGDKRPDIDRNRPNADPARVMRPDSGPEKRPGKKPDAAPKKNRDSAPKRDGSGGKRRE